MIGIKIKIVYLFIMFTVSSCAQKLVQDTSNISFSEEELQNKALEALDIDRSKTGYILSKIFPNNSKETIIVIEEIVKEEEWSSESNSHIVIINNTTGKITHTFFESSETNGWDSNAIFIDNIAIDTLNYELNASKIAFGVKVHFRNNSQPNPYAYETLSLFTKEKNSLKKILDFYPVYESWGEVNVTTCYADFKTTVSKLSMSAIKTNGYHDVLVKKTVSQRRYKEDEHGDCNPKDSIPSTENKKLMFNGETYTEKPPVTLATVDSVSVGEIKQFTDRNLLTIFDYYKKERIDEVEIWSEKMFGRCCSEADMDYSDLLEFDITAIPRKENYPFSNLSDNTYRTAFVFKEQEKTEIYIKLNRNDETHTYFTKLELDEVLHANDTLLNPFKLSLVNGYVKSKKTFTENGRIKELTVFLNDNYKGTILLIDTPVVQEFQLDFLFTKNDMVKLVPITFYKGTKYDDVCISEIQSSLSHSTHSSINKKYKITELRKR